MIRKFAIAAAAIAALGTTSLALTTVPASAKGGWGHHHGWHRGGYVAFYPVASCYRDVWVVTRRGERVLRTINVCD